jgi:hypothetical protein
VTSEQMISWAALVVQCLRYGVPIIAGAWAIQYGMRGFLRMLAT